MTRKPGALPGATAPMFLAMNGKEMGVEHAVLFRARDLQVPPECRAEDIVADT